MNSQLIVSDIPVPEWVSGVILERILVDIFINHRTKYSDVLTREALLSLFVLPDEVQEISLVSLWSITPRKTD